MNRATAAGSLFFALGLSFAGTTLAATAAVEAGTGAAAASVAAPAASAQVAVVVAKTAAASAPGSDAEGIFLCTAADGSTELSNHSTGPECEKLVEASAATDASTQRTASRGRDADQSVAPAADKPAADAEVARADRGDRGTPGKDNADAARNVGNFGMPTQTVYSSYAYDGGAATVATDIPSATQPTMATPDRQTPPAPRSNAPATDFVPTVAGHLPTGVTTPTLASTNVSDQGQIYRTRMIAARGDASAPAYLQNPAIGRRYLATTRAAFGQ